VESQHLRFIQSPPSNIDFAMAVNRFNCNISYSGLLHAVTAEVTILLHYPIVNFINKFKSIDFGKIVTKIVSQEDL